MSPDFADFAGSNDVRSDALYNGHAVLMTAIAAA